MTLQNAPYEFRNEKRTFYYLGGREAKSRKGGKPVRALASELIRQVPALHAGSLGPLVKARDLGMTSSGWKSRYLPWYHCRNFRKAAPRWLYCAFSSAVNSANAF
jgi:hypothetical protein